MRMANDRQHPYLKGYNFWSKNQFWETDGYTEKAKEYYRAFLNNMQKKDRKLSSVSDQAR